ncbi:pickpocket protein 28 [Scaptodrosophila lebanonensis]|uniref:Pickpocket protein 28 n=1 Tax=Drosophila lebanonensis TaxID=7225 RepID=A0A6J2TMV9_DROLE|nr:pickpocket protein 28 [Scaptodrosophila lebanonensis]
MSIYMGYVGQKPQPVALRLRKPASQSAIGLLNNRQRRTDWAAMSKQIAHGNVERPQEQSWAWKLVAYLKDYCANCTLVGFAYIANQNLHPLERIFWVSCVLLSAMGCYHLISEYQRDFPIRAVSIVYESLSPFQRVKFPTVSVCDFIYKDQVGAELENFIASLGTGLIEEYNYEVESHMEFILFPYLYHEGAIRSSCEHYETCEQCAKCQKKNYRDFLTRFGANCSDMFIECTLAGSTFDCCKYFLPLTTPYGRCFLLNSLQNNQRNSKHWLPTMLDPGSQKAIMQLLTYRSIYVSLMDEEDLPHTALSGVGVSISAPGQQKTIQFYLEAMDNDDDVRNIPGEVRKCYFPDELLPGSVYKAYSFSSCISDCARLIQLELCNCTSYTFNPFNDSRFPDCDMDGYLCLEDHSMVKPDAKFLMQLKSPKLSCSCLPSCNEVDKRMVYESVSSYNLSSQARNITLSMPIWPTDQYRRQALRTRLDVVVTMGGMLGLFLGASILSGIEFVYYFTLRAANTALEERRNQSPRPARAS